MSKQVKKHCWFLIKYLNSILQDNSVPKEYMAIETDAKEN